MCVISRDPNVNGTAGIKMHIGLKGHTHNTSRLCRTRKQYAPLKQCREHWLLPYTQTEVTEQQKLCPSPPPLDEYFLTANRKCHGQGESRSNRIQMINIALAVLKYYKSVHIISGSFFDSCDIYLSVRPQHTIIISFVTGHFQNISSCHFSTFL